jgi:hypothetical protein
VLGANVGVGAGMGHEGTVVEVDVGVRVVVDSSGQEEGRLPDKESGSGSGSVCRRVCVD